MNRIIFGVANKFSIAWSIARAWDAAGANVIMVCRSDREHAAVNKLATELINSSNPVLICDVQDEQVLASTFAQVNDIFQGELHSVLHGIAAAPPGVLSKPLYALTSEEFLSTQSISAYSLLSMTRHALPLLTATNTTNTTNTTNATNTNTTNATTSSSATSISASPSITTLSYIGSNLAVPGYGAMGCAKASLEASVRYLAQELGGNGIRVNCVNAPPTKTLSARAIPNFHTMKTHSIDHSCLKRDISHDEIANYVTFLASSQASGITGQIVQVDGGYSATSGPV
jgi:enoyl-[acyl-carrier protein] reductase I